MSLIVRNKTGSPVDIDDLGLRIAASADRDIQYKGIATVLDSVDLIVLLAAGTLAILDPADDTTELGVAASQAVLTGTAVYDDSGGGGGGSSVDRQMASNASSFVTTSQSLVDLTGMTLTTNDLGESGTYVITFSCEYEHEADNEDCTFSLNIDGGEVTSRRSVGYKKSEFGNFSMTHLATGIASGTVIKVQVSQSDNDTDTDELTIENKQLVIDGVGDSNVV